MVIISKSEKDTQQIAANLAVKIRKSPTSLFPCATAKAEGGTRFQKATESQRKLRMASVITLEGELGAGKTTFVKGFAKALGIKAKVKSPTFVLMKKYQISPSNYSLAAKCYLYHLDCYRVRDHRDLATLDLKSLFKSSDNTILVEWPERISKILPNKLIRVHIDHIDYNKRKITIS